MNNKIQNELLNFDLPMIYFQDNHPKSNEIRNQMVKNLVKINSNEINVLEQTFFSDENIDIINKQLILGVWKKTKGAFKINYQDKKKLIIVMRYIFIESAKHLPYDIAGQIKDLNCLVVKHVLPSIITNIEQKMGYLRDIEKRGNLPPLPTSSTADRTLPTAGFM